MKRRREGDFLIPVSSLKDGVSEFSYDITEDIFRDGENECEILDRCRIVARCIADKSPTAIVVNINMEGHVDTRCDRCNGSLTLPIKRSVTIILKFVEETNFEGEGGSDTETYPVRREQPYFALDDVFHDYVLLSVPRFKVHEPGHCSPEFEKILKKYNEENMQFYLRDIIHGNTNQKNGYA